MTNVPGIVPQPYPIVNYPGTFAIILRKVAIPFFWGGADLAALPHSRRAHNFFRQFFRIFFSADFVFGGFFSAEIFRTAVGHCPEKLNQ